MPGLEAEYADDLSLISRATAAAAALAMDYFARGGVARWDKAPGNPVTAADLAVDALLKAELLSARPDDGWLSEETADAPARLARRRVWVVDPIDGTRDFIRGRTGWAVSVALVKDGAPLLACLAAPARGETFVAVTGCGATRNGMPLAVSGRSDIAGVRLSADAAGLAHPRWPEPWDAVAVDKPNSLALRMALVATGTADGIIDGRTVNEWDVAAATLIVTEAGGRVSDLADAALVFNQAVPVVAGLVTATPGVHAELRRRLAAGVAAWRR